MFVVLGLIILLAAVVVGVAGVFNNLGSEHALTHGFSVFGYHVTGSTGELFLYGIVIGAAALLGLGLLLAGARRAARRGRSARRALKDSGGQTGTVQQDRDLIGVTHGAQARADETTRSETARADETARAQTARADETTRSETARADEATRSETARADETARAQTARADETTRSETARADETTRSETARADEASRARRDSPPEGNRDSGTGG
jgi:type IV secretory pathway TrbL component